MAIFSERVIAEEVSFKNYTINSQACEQATEELI